MPMSEFEKGLLFQLIEKLTGSYQSGAIRKEILIPQVEDLLQKKKCRSLKEFLLLSQSDSSVNAEFISTITNHTTSWFRESEHFVQLKKEVTIRYNKGQRLFSIWSCAASTGEEVYSIALLMEELRGDHPDLEYQILGTDIDELSLSKALRAIYTASDMGHIPREYHKHLLIGSKSGAGLFTLKKTLRDRCKFEIHNLVEGNLGSHFETYDFIFCRNVLIYFHISRAKRVVEKLATQLKDGGKLFLGLSESMTEKMVGLTSTGLSCYVRHHVQLNTKKRALIIDDVAVVRIPIRMALKKAQFEVVEAASAEEANSLITQGAFDFITLDLHLPGKNGIAWLREFRAAGYTTPLVIISGSTESAANLVYGALGSGAQDYIEKDKLSSELGRLASLAMELSIQEKESGALLSLVPSKVWDLNKKKPDLIVIGASTGGPNAIWTLLKSFPRPTPPILIVQHTSTFFVRQFSETLANASGLPVIEGSPGDLLQANNIYISMGDYHIGVEKASGGLCLKHDVCDPICGHRPSVEYLFSSVAQCQVPAVGILLTGMGQDGAGGMFEMQKTGLCYNMAQDSESCVVYGMPKAALEAKAVNFVGDIAAIRKKIESLIQVVKNKGAA